LELESWVRAGAEQVNSFHRRTRILPAAALFSLVVGLQVSAKPAVASPVGSKPSNLLVITVDTLRADHVGCYGFEKAKTPNIDRLARSGVRFENAISQVPITFPSHCVIFASTYPQYSLVRDNGTDHLDSSAITLAEIMQGKGMATAAFVSAFVLDPRFGLNQGFQLYDYVQDTRENKTRVELQYAERSADTVTPLVIQWIRKNKSKPFFVWAHYYDVHHPYEPPSPYKELFRDQPYDGEIAFVDTQIGIVLSELRDLDLDKSTLVVLTSDHGEGLGDHGESMHAVLLYDATQKVPLIFSRPGSIPEGKVEQRQVRLVDLTPTILELFRIPRGPQMQGDSLVPLLMNAEGTMKDLPAYSESLYAKLHYNYSELHAWREGEWKYIDSTEPELYNTKTDPRETVNLFQERNDIASRLDGELNAFLKKTSSKQNKEDRVEPDEETKSKLNSLGYLGGSAGSESKKPAPLKMIQVIETLNLASRLMSFGRNEKAVEILGAIVKQHPDNARAYVLLGHAYAELKRDDMAVRNLRKAASYEPDNAEAHEGIGNVYKRMGKVDAALEEFELARRLDPQNARILTNIGWCFQQKMRVDEALAYYDKALALDESIATAHANRAICYHKKGRMPDAMRELKRAIELDPELAFARAELCACLFDQGELNGAIESCKKAIALDPKSFDGHTNLGVCLARQGDMTKALASFVRAKEVAPSNPIGYINLGRAYLALGNRVEAESSFKKALEIDPSNRVAAQALNKLRSPGSR
jgi:arylsulfatase A-like enzyme/Tfp pilus assembly protein PilF